MKPQDLRKMQKMGYVGGVKAWGGGASRLGADRSDRHGEERVK